MPVVTRADLNRMERTPATRGAAGAGTALPPATAAVETLFGIHRQDRLAGVLDATAAAAVRLGVPAAFACLLRDPGTDAWHLTSLLDHVGRPAPTIYLGLPSGSFPFSPPADVAARPLAALLGDAWGTERCHALARRLGVEYALCATLVVGGAPRGALLALPAALDSARLLSGVLVHAAVAATRLIERESVLQADGVLAPERWSERALNEIDRAAHYERKLAVVVFELPTTGDLARQGPLLARSLGRHTFTGRIEGERPALAALLPETDRAGIRPLLTRLGALLENVTVGAAVLGDDGATLDQLLAVAKGRIARPVAFTGSLPADPAPHDVFSMMQDAGIAVTWTRGAPTGTGVDAVRCPRCLASYTCRSSGGRDRRGDEQARLAARAFLHADCPNHLDRIVVAA